MRCDRHTLQHRCRVAEDKTSDTQSEYHQHARCRIKQPIRKSPQPNMALIDEQHVEYVAEVSLQSCSRRRSSHPFGLNQSAGYLLYLGVILRLPPPKQSRGRNHKRWRGNSPTIVPLTAYDTVGHPCGGPPQKWL